jgi:hypothetical protein
MSLKLHNQSLVQTTVATGYHSSADGVFDYDVLFRQRNYHREMVLKSGVLE